jgi:glycerate 2-kinase
VTPLADLARAMYGAAVTAVQPATLLRRADFLPAGVSFADASMAPAGRLVLLALGKAAPGLAAAFLQRCERTPDDLFVLAPAGVPVPERVAAQTRLGGHPLPDARGEAASRELLDLVTGLAANDGVVLLLSGGASALLALPLAGVDRARAAALTARLLQAGARIDELNAVRKHLFAAAGGRLAAACQAPILTLAISDVPGDDLAVIASGPTVADPTTFAEAGAVLRRRRLEDEFPDVVEYLAAGERGACPESPKPGDIRLARATTRLLASSQEALEAAAATATEAGFAVRRLTRTLRGEARAVGEALGLLAASLASASPVALLGGGETTVTVRGAGRGGRNLEVALAAACALAGTPERCVLAAGSDGVDGSSPAAGAVVDGATLDRAAQRGRDATLALADNDSWGFFEGAPEAIVTGPTGTNVADLVFVLAAGARAEFLTAAATASLQIGELRGQAGCPPTPPPPRRSNDRGRSGSLHLRR